MLAIRLLFGQGEFEETLRITALRGLDADTTASQASAVMGVIVGAAGIPAKWKDPLGDQVETHVEGFEKVKISELSEKIIRAKNHFERRSS